jgi:hypothetical protein
MPWRCTPHSGIINALALHTSQLNFNSHLTVLITVTYLVQAMNTRRRNGSTALPTLDLGTRGKWAVSFIPSPLKPRKGTQYTLNRTLGGSQT